MSTIQPTRQGATPKRLLLVDDHDLLRAGVRCILEGEGGLEIVGEATNGRQALTECQRLRPDLVLMDVRMPEMDGLEASRAIKHVYPQTRIIILTIYENPDYLLEAINIGIDGYILKGASRQELLHAVWQVLGGESILDHQLTARALKQLATESTNMGDALVEHLTSRESEVLELLAQGLTNLEIANALTVSRGTVKRHIEHIFGKLGTSDRTQAAVRAVELGLLNPL